MASERKFIRENMKRVMIKEFLMRRAQDAGFGGVTIQRTPLGTRVTLMVERPGMVIGRHGGLIKQLTEILERDFGLDNPQVEVQEARAPNINAQIMAQKLAFALERGWHFRRGGHSTVRRIMEAGAKGCQVTLAGKLTGDRHRTEKFKQGHIKFCGEPALQWMRHGYAVAKKKSGVIGVTVRVMDPKAVLPDEVAIRPSEDVADLVPPVPAQTPAEEAPAGEPATGAPSDEKAEEDAAV
ncbi:MAG TPA: 30S ribosomal protein S3, partial [Thermoplasmata archaeon]|nr:30S ribosomal protein S3 [Thermoplasmata archaeon]